MNIDDVKKVDIPESGKLLPSIFAHQRVLMEKYHDIEVSNGANSPEPPWNIDDKLVQWRLKDLFWRTTEEIAEAHECKPARIPPQPMQVWDSDTNLRHFFEELIDSLHFLVEASIVAGMPFHNDDSWHRSILIIRAHQRRAKIKDCIDTVGCTTMMTFNFIAHMGLAANCLKNKPWKQTQMLTDKDKFNTHLAGAWHSFFRMWYEYGMSLQDMYVIYAKKARVNEFRQRSQY